MVAVSIQIIGLDALQQSFDTFQKRWQDKKPLFEQAAKNYYALVEKKFIDGQNTWQPISDAWANERGSDSPILINTGALADAATGFGMTGFGGTGYSVGPDIKGFRDINQHSMRLGVEGDKTRNQFGFTNQWGKHTPARPFWPFEESEGVDDAVFSPFESWLDGWLNGPQQIGFWGP